MTDLDKLIGVVEGGEDIYDFVPMFDMCESLGFKREFAYTWKAAYQGSLDAAKALHEALLPGWGSKIEIHGAVSFSWVGKEDEMLFPQHSTSYHSPARAWLIAILKAYRAQVGEKKSSTAFGSEEG